MIFLYCEHINKERYVLYVRKINIRACFEYLADMIYLFRIQYAAYLMDYQNQNRTTRVV